MVTHCILFLLFFCHLFVNTEYLLEKNQVEIFHCRYNLVYKYTHCTYTHKYTHTHMFYRQGEVCLRD